MILLSMAPESSPLQINGNGEIHYGQTDRNNNIQNSLNYQYNVFAQKHLFSSISTRSSLRFSQQDSWSDNSSLSSHSLQPIGELNWNNPYYSLGGYGQRRSIQNDGDIADFVRDDGGIHFKSKWSQYPVIGLRYNLVQNKTPEDISIRNNFEERAGADLSYNYSNFNSTYNFNRNYFKNRNSSVSHTANSNRLTLSQRQNFFDNHYRLYANYLLNYRTNKYQNPDTLNPEIPWTASSAFFSFDFTPEEGKMDSIPGLIDGNLESAASPNTYIGLNSQYSNYALDLGQERTISGIYVYTDSIPYAPGIWEVYYSEDLFFNSNMDWQKIDANFEVDYDPDFFRINLEFNDLTARFIKTVNISNPDTGTVFVTEIQVFKNADKRGDLIQENSSQTFSINNTFVFTENFQTSFDVAFQNEPLSKVDEKKNDVFFTLSARHRMTPTVTNSIRFQSEHRNLGYIQNTTDGRILNVGSRFIPNEDLSFSLGLTDQWNEIDGRPIQDNKSIVLQLNGSALPTLNLSSEIGFNYFTQENERLKSSSWNYRLSVDGNLTRELSALAGYSFKFTEDNKGAPNIYRNQWNFNLSWRLTGKIFIGSRLTLQVEKNIYFTQHYTFNWNILPRWNSGVQLTNFYQEKGFESNRFNFYSNFRTFKMCFVYFRFGAVRTLYYNLASDDLNLESNSFQLGMRVGI